MVDLGADGECRQEPIQRKHWRGGGLGLLPSQRTVNPLCGGEVTAGVALACVRWIFQEQRSAGVPHGCPNRALTLTLGILVSCAGGRESQTERDAGGDGEGNHGGEAQSNTGD